MFWQAKVPQGNKQSRKRSIYIWTVDKGQTKSKLFFQADVSSKKQMKEFYFTAMKPQVDLFSLVFFEEIEDTKKTFPDYLTI